MWKWDDYIYMQRRVPPSIRKGAENEVNDILTEGLPSPHKQIRAEHDFFQNSSIYNKRFHCNE